MNYIILKSIESVAGSRHALWLILSSPATTSHFMVHGGLHAFFPPLSYLHFIFPFLSSLYLHLLTLTSPLLSCIFSPQFSSPLLPSCILPFTNLYHRNYEASFRCVWHRGGTEKGNTDGKKSIATCSCVKSEDLLNRCLYF